VIKNKVNLTAWDGVKILKNIYKIKTKKNDVVQHEKHLRALAGGTLFSE
jgi:hypothetical protein